MLLLLLLPLFLVLIILLQGMYLKKKAVRLPEADGERININHSNLSLLHIGESPVVGVGVKDLKQGVTYPVINQLSQTLHTELDWEILGRNGARAVDALTFEPTIKKPDILIITFGVNDTTAFTRSSTWINQLKKCVSVFSSHSTDVFFTSIPKLHKFPLLPPPLSWVLGSKAYFLDRKIQQLCRQQGWVYISSEIHPEPSLMARDGYHPNESGYKVWASLIATEITRTIKRTFEKTVPYESSSGSKTQPGRSIEKVATSAPEHTLR